MKRIPVKEYHPPEEIADFFVIKRMVETQLIKLVPYDVTDFHLDSLAIIFYKDGRNISTWQIPPNDSIFEDLSTMEKHTPLSIDKLPNKQKNPRSKT